MPGASLGHVVLGGSLALIALAVVILATKHCPRRGGDGDAASAARVDGAMRAAEAVDAMGLQPFAVEPGEAVRTKHTASRRTAHARHARRGLHHHR
jgi:hypothetical protein